MEKTNEGGWHSQDDLHEDDHFATLKSEIINLSQEVMNHLAVEDHLIPEISGLWAVVNGPGSTNKLHTHPFNYLSGVFYLQVPKDSGPLVFWILALKVKFFFPLKNLKKARISVTVFHGHPSLMT